MSQLKLPIKRGTFIEYRSGLINIAPIGRSCTREQRNDFEQYDAVHNIRRNFVEALKKDLSHLELQYSIGNKYEFNLR